MPETSEPAIILVRPQLGQNIGAAARAMLNCGLHDLRLVAPRDGWPDEAAFKMAAGALDKMPGVRVYDTTAQAVADCHFVYATTARPRDMVMPVFTPDEAARDIRQKEAGGNRAALLYGAERTGLDNDDVALANAVITAPLNHEFTSLNLAQAVLLTAYAWYEKGDDTSGYALRTGDSEPVSAEKLNEFLERLDRELEAHHFYRNPDMRPSMRRNIINIFTRAELTDQEVRTLHGILSALTGKKAP